jgi:predicted HNH restriction endonuclease
MCGYDKYDEALEFHHLDPSEKETGSEIRNLSWARLRLELDKCILVCANCHREIHAKLRKMTRYQIIQWMETSTKL